MLPDALPDKLLFISAGSGITPIMSMLRHLDRSGELDDAVLLHSARRADEVIFGDELRDLARRHPRFVLHEQLTADNGRMGPSDLDRLCTDWTPAPDLHLGPDRHARRVHRALRAVGRRRAPAPRALPAQARPRRRGGGGGRDDRVPEVRLPGAVRRQPADPRRRRGGGPRPARSAAARASATPASANCAPAGSATCATARSTARRARSSGPASALPRDRSRSNYETDTTRRTHDDRCPQRKRPGPGGGDRRAPRTRCIG